MTHLCNTATKQFLKTNSTNFKLSSLETLTEMINFHQKRVYRSVFTKKHIIQVIDNNLHDKIKQQNNIYLTISIFMNALWL